MTTGGGTLGASQRGQGSWRPGAWDPPLTPLSLLSEMGRKSTGGRAWFVASDGLPGKLGLGVLGPVSSELPWALVPGLRPGGASGAGDRGEVCVGGEQTGRPGLAGTWEADEQINGSESLGEGRPGPGVLQLTWEGGDGGGAEGREPPLLPTPVRAWAAGASSSPQGSGCARSPGASTSSTAPAPARSAALQRRVRARLAARRRARRAPAAPAAPAPGGGGSGDGSEQEERARVRRERIKSRTRRAAPRLPPPGEPRPLPAPSRVSEGRGAPRREGGEQQRQRKTPPGTPAGARAGSRGLRRKGDRADGHGRASAQNRTQGPGAPG